MDQERSHRSFGDREFDMSKFLDIENPDIVKITIEFGPSNPERIKTVDHSSVRIGVRDFEMSKSLVNENPEIAKHDIAIQSQPLIQARIWTVHLYGHVAARRPHRQFGDREFIIQRTQCIKNSEIAKCDFAK